LSQELPAVSVTKLKHVFFLSNVFSPVFTVFFGAVRNALRAYRKIIEMTAMDHVIFLQARMHGRSAGRNGIVFVPLQDMKPGFLTVFRRSA